MPKRAPDPRLQAWLSTDIAGDLSPIKRKNYFTRLFTWFGDREVGLRSSVLWPCLPLGWARPHEAWPGVPRPFWPVTNVVYRVTLLETARIGAFLRALAGFLTPIVEHGGLGDAWAWVAWDAERAWVFVDSIQRFDAGTDGEQWMCSWAEVGDLVWVEWRHPADLRCRWEQGGRRRDFVPDAVPPPRDFDFAPDDVAAMRALLAQGPMRSDPERLPDWLLQRFARGDLQIRMVPFAFEGHMCFPGDAAPGG